MIKISSPQCRIHSLKNPSLWGSVQINGNRHTSPQCRIYNMKDPSLWGSFWISLNHNSSPQCRRSLGKFLPHNVGFIPWKILHCGEVSDYHSNRHASPQCKIYNIKDPLLWGSFWFSLTQNSSSQWRIKSGSLSKRDESKSKERCLA